jgi:hypothetical protein
VANFHSSSHLLTTVSDLGNAQLSIPEKKNIKLNNRVNIDYVNLIIEVIENFKLSK